MEKKTMGLCWCLEVLGLMVLVTTANSVTVDAMTCQQALTTLMPCQPFLAGGAPAPIAPCCLAVANVNAAATTTQMRRDLCRCFKQYGPGLGVRPEKAKQLPQLCGVSVPLPIDPSVNCDTILFVGK